MGKTATYARHPGAACNPNSSLVAIHEESVDRTLTHPSLVQETLFGYQPSEKKVTRIGMFRRSAKIRSLFFNRLLIAGQKWLPDVPGHRTIAGVQPQVASLRGLFHGVY